MGLKKVRGGWVKKPQTRLFYMAQKGILWFERWLIFLYFYISASALSSSSDIWECIVTVGWSTQLCLQEVLPRSSCCHPWMVFPPPVSCSDCHSLSWGLHIYFHSPSFSDSQETFLPLKFKSNHSWAYSWITKSGWRVGSWWLGFCSGLLSKASKEPCEERSLLLYLRSELQPQPYSVSLHFAHYAFNTQVWFFQELMELLLTFRV